MAQSFQDILSQVLAQSDPQRSAIMNQIAALPNQQQADESGLNAQKNAAYDQITNQAQERGMGFSGIPLGEQAKYDSTTYAPALASLKSNYVTQQGNLQTALAGVGSNDYGTAMSQFNTQNSLAEQQREFDANLAAQKASSTASNAGLAALLGGGTQQAAPADPYASIDKNSANTAIKSLLSTNNAGTIGKTMQAISKSASYGNVYDQYKLELLNELTKDSQYGPLLNKASQYSVATGGF